MDNKSDTFRYENFDGHSKAMMRRENQFKPTAYQILKENELRNEQQLKNMQNYNSEILRKNKSDIVINTDIIKFNTNDTAQTYMDFVRDNIYIKKNQPYNYDDWYKAPLVRTKPPETKEKLTDEQRLFFDRYAKNLQREVTKIEQPTRFNEEYVPPFSSIKTAKTMIDLNDKIRKNDVQSQQKYKLHVPVVERNLANMPAIFDHSMKYEKRKQRQYEEMNYLNRDTQNYRMQEKIKKKFTQKSGWFKFYIESIQNVYSLYPEIVKFKFRVAQNKQEPVYIKESLEYEISKEVDNYKFLESPKFKVTEITNVFNNYYLYIYLYDTHDKLIAWSMHEIYNAVNSLNRGLYKIPLYHPSYSPADLLAEAIPMDEKFSLIISVQAYGLKYDNPNIQMQNIHEKIQQKMSGKYRTEDRNVEAQVTKIFATKNQKKIFSAQEQDKFRIDRLVAQMRLQGNSNSSVLQKQREQLEKIKHEENQKQKKDGLIKKFQYGKLYRGQQEQIEAQIRHNQMLQQMEEEQTLKEEEQKMLKTNISGSNNRQSNQSNTFVKQEKSQGIPKTKFGELEIEDLANHREKLNYNENDPQFQENN